MFQKPIISKESSLYKFFEKLKLDLYLTKLQINHLENIMNATLAKGYKGKVSDVASSISQRHRTSITRFLSSDAWNEEHIRRSLKSLILNLIWKNLELLKSQYTSLLMILFRKKLSPRQRL